MEPLNYDYEYTLKVQENIKLFRDQINFRSVKVKIDNWAKKYGLHPYFVWHKACIDDAFAMNFITEPGRQGFHEKLAAQYIASFDCVRLFKNMPNGGPNSLLVSNGFILTSAQARQAAQNPKTIDFQWEVQTISGTTIKCYASHKYTKDPGGSQDNQYRDICEFMENARQNREENVLFFAITDGEYYQSKLRGSNKTKLADMNEQFGKENKVIALTINDLYNELVKIIDS